MTEPGEHELTLHGNRVRYLMAGSGPAVLLIHGITSSADTWRPAMDALSRDHTVIAPDLLGHGASAKPRGDYSLGAYASGVRDLLAALGHDRVSVVGHSLGGGVAMQFAYQFPERTERLVLVSGGGGGPAGARPRVGGRTARPARPARRRGDRARLRVPQRRVRPRRVPAHAARGDRSARP